MTLIFAYDTSLFYWNKEIKAMFNKMKFQLKHIIKWLKTNKLSINIDKANFILFHKQQDKVNIPLKLPTLTKGVGIHLMKI